MPMQILKTVKIPISLRLNDTQKTSIVDTSKVFDNCVLDFIAKCCEKQSYFGIYNEFYYYVKERNSSALADMITTSARKAVGLVRAYNGSLKRVNKQIINRNRRRSFKSLEPLLLKEKWNFVPNMTDSGYSLTSHMFSLKNDTASVSTINGRIKFACHIPKWFEEKYPIKRFYSGWMSCKSPLKVTKQRPNIDEFREYNLYLTYIIDEEHPVEMREITPETTIGVDRGIHNIIVTSDGTFVSSKPYYAIERKYAHNISILKQKHSSSARKRLRSIRGKQKRYINDRNHIISKKLCSIPNLSCIIFEQLNGIRDSHTKCIRKSKKSRKPEVKQNRWINNWTFKDLEDKVLYKANDLGITVEFVNPAYTSKTCSECGYVESHESECRNGKNYKCSHCNHSEHADLNASKNIKKRYFDRIKDSFSIDT